MRNFKTAGRESGGLCQVAPTSASLPRRLPRILNQRPGFTLLEILASVVVLSVGILGVTAMQTASLNGQLLSRNLGTAYNVVHDALDRMQTNSENITSYINNNYSQPFTVTANISDRNPSDNTGERPAAGTTAADDYDAIYMAMLDMKLSSGVLTVQLSNDDPYTGVDSATAKLTWNYKGKTRTCEVHTELIKEGR
ncbi:MAG: prepilin-type N-terminal cleavage/methylation domain-containing protein [Nitrospinota bacterium]|nr:prepilin-type N-terminal cleavage/methylation domain-containing protein [Nitrospinota bacterium]